MYPSPEVTADLLKRIEPTARIALDYYQRISDGLVFDENASKLKPTTDKPNSARSETIAKFQGEPIGNLYVIAFKPGDGTGSEVNYQLENLQVDSPYTREALIVPRNKTGVHSEVHMTLATYDSGELRAEPKLYAGRFDLIGLDGNTVSKIGELGNSAQRDVAIPVRTFTVGWRNGIRVGDPHAVFNPLSSKLVQVCAFLAISDEMYKAHPTVWNGLKPQFPADQTDFAFK